MNNPERVQIGRTGHDFRELKVIKDRKSGIHGETASGLTNSRRFAFGLGDALIILAVASGHFGKFI
jgi:hypothetical protein